MSNQTKSKREILEKLGIEALNKMQNEAQNAILNFKDVMLLSPTGSGKTLAFLLPIIDLLDNRVKDIQVLIIVPSRELAIQINQVFREMGTGFKSNAVYGGQSFSTDLLNLKHLPTFLIGTPGRIADHLKRNTFSTNQVKTLVLDEFDKSLEIGFESEMKFIVNALKSIDKRILTSATNGVEVPHFVGVNKLKVINYLAESKPNIEIKTVKATSKNKLDSLVELIKHFDTQPGIIFCNFKNTIEFVSNYLESKGIQHGVFYGGMEQKDRERSLIKFRNKTYSLLVATDLAARGIDIPEIKYIIHYQLPIKEEEFIHRNGRTARMNSDGFALVLHGPKEHLPDFILNANPQKFDSSSIEIPANISNETYSTIFISGGRRDKISKGDIAGLLFKQGGLSKNEVGIIELKQDCAFVAISTSKIESIISRLNNSKLKKRKIRIYQV